VLSILSVILTRVELEGRRPRRSRITWRSMPSEMRLETYRKPGEMGVALPSGDFKTDLVPRFLFRPPKYIELRYVDKTKTLISGPVLTLSFRTYSMYRCSGIPEFRSLKTHFSPYNYIGNQQSLLVELLVPDYP
jgi:hypothetical protein